MEGVWSGKIEKDTLLFTVFNLNPYKPQETLKHELNLVLSDFLQYLDVWQRYFPWADEILKVTLESQSDKKPSYILGKIHFGQIVEDEWLSVFLLHDFLSKRTYKFIDDLFVHFADQDGEFLLIEAFDYLPEWCVPSQCANRLWFTGKLQPVLIPNDFSYNQSLSLLSAIEYLEKYSFKLDIKILEGAHEHKWKPVFDLYPKASLQLVVTENVELNRTTASSLIDSFNEKKNLVSKSLINYRHLKYPDLICSSDLVSLKVNIPCLYYLHILKRYEVKQPKDISFSQYLGSAITLGLDSSENLHDDSNIEDFNRKIEENPLQTKLIEAGTIELKIPTIPFDELYRQADEWINEQQIETQKDMEKLTEKLFQDFEKPENLDDFGYDQSSSDSDDDAVEYFRNENATVNEDDFFEFILKEGIHLSPDQMNQLRRGNHNKIPAGQTKTTLTITPETFQEESDEDLFGEDLLPMGPEELNTLRKAIELLQTS